MKTRGRVWSYGAMHSSRTQNSCLFRQTLVPILPDFGARYVANALFLRANICCRLPKGHMHIGCAFYGGWNINSEKQKSFICPGADKALVCNRIVWQGSLRYWLCSTTKLISLVQENTYYLTVITFNVITYTIQVITCRWFNLFLFSILVATKLSLTEIQI
jgi:hypothetical protein